MNAHVTIQVSYCNHFMFVVLIKLYEHVKNNNLILFQLKYEKNYIKLSLAIYILFKFIVKWLQKKTNSVISIIVPPPLPENLLHSGVYTRGGGQL